MKELTLILDCLGHEELKEYLSSLKGVLNVTIKNEKNLEIYIKYDNAVITTKMLKGEILLFLKSTKVPSIVSFDKYPSCKIKKYKLENNGCWCCEYCLKGIIDDLFEIEGIEKATSNYFEDNNLKDSIIELEYNPAIISEADINKLGIYD